MKFEIVHTSKKSNARVGRIHTPHGVIDTPNFVAVGTNGTLKGLDNTAVSKTGANGPHTTGKAIDIAVRDSQHRKQLITYFAPEVTGLGIAKSFIHIDLLYEEDGFEMRPNCWVY